MFMKLIYSASISIFLVSSCVNTPEMPELSSKSIREFNNVRKYLKCDNIKQRYKREYTNSYDRLSFSILLYDIRAKQINYDSLNKVILDIYEANKYKLKNCYHVSIYYLNNFENADLRKVYIFDGKRNLVEVAYD